LDYEEWPECVNIDVSSQKTKIFFQRRIKMSDVPMQVVVAAFQDEAGAKAAYQELRQAKKAHLIKIENAAVIRKDEKGKLHIKETHDMGGGKGAGIGALAGGAIGLIGGPGGVVVGGAVGAFVGGLTAKLYDGGFKDERLEKIGGGLQPGTSAIVAVVDHTWVQEVEKELAEQAIDVTVAALAEDIAQQLKEGNEVAYSEIATDEGTEVSRVAGNDKEVDVSNVVATAAGVEAVHMHADEEGVVVEHAVATEDAIAYEAVAADENDAAYVAALATPEGAAMIAAESIPDEEEDQPEEEAMDGAGGESDTESEEGNS
jgi:uncharacterized membrane protein